MAESPLTDLFSITRVRGAYRHIAARRAVLGRLTGAGDQLEAVAGGFAVLRRMWAAKLYALRDAGWRPLNGPGAKGDLGSMLKCPPFGVVTRTKARRCNRSYVCPFCYARDRVLRAFCNLEHTLYGPDCETRSKPELLAPHLKILWFRRQLAGSARCGPFAGPESVAAHWAYIHALLPNMRQSELRVFGTRTGYVLFHAYPSARGEHIKLWRGGVLLVDPKAFESRRRRSLDAAVQEYADMPGSRIGLLEPTKKNLMTAVVTALGYKRSIFTCRADLLTAFLHAIHGDKLAQWYGPRPPRDVEDEDADPPDAYMRSRRKKVVQRPDLPDE